jgi:hypothetical protein
VCNLRNAKRVSCPSHRSTLAPRASKNTEKLFDEITSLLEVDKDKFQYAPVVLEIENKHFQANELAVFSFSVFLLGTFSA